MHRPFFIEGEIHGWLQTVSAGGRHHRAQPGRDDRSRKDEAPGQAEPGQLITWEAEAWLFPASSCEVTPIAVDAAGNSDRLTVVGFLDAGQVWEGVDDDVRLVATPGVGIRFNSPVGPLRMDLGYNTTGTKFKPVVVVEAETGEIIELEDPRGRLALPEDRRPREAAPDEDLFVRIVLHNKLATSQQCDRCIQGVLDEVLDTLPASYQSEAWWIEKGL